MTDNGHAAEFAAFVRADWTSLLRFAVAICGNRPDAEDLVQTALTNTYARWPSVRRANPAAYVRRAVVNGRTSTWRRRRRESPLLPHHDRAELSDAFGQRDDRQWLLGALATIPLQQRTVLVLRYLDGWDDTAISSVLDIRPVTVRTHALRGLLRLRELAPPGSDLPDPTDAPQGARR